MLSAISGPPFFSLTTRVELFFTLQIRDAAGNGLGVTSEHTRNVLDPAMPEFRRLHRSVSSLITFVQRPIKPPLELNRCAVGAGERFGVGRRFVSCECEGLLGSGCIDGNEDSDLRPADL